MMAGGAANEDIITLDDDLGKNHPTDKQGSNI